MQSGNPFFDDLARVAEYAADAAIAAGKEANSAARGGVDEIVSNLGMVSREDFAEALTELRAAKETIADLEERVAALESASVKRKSRAARTAGDKDGAKEE